MAYTYVAIMAGAVGSRFWPVSRTHYPKHFLDIFATGKSLLQSTFERFICMIPVERIYVITSAEYAELVMEQLPDIRISNILAEPCRINTTPCFALIAARIGLTDSQANLIITPDDHFIMDVQGFISTCQKALSFIEKVNAYVALGIKPSYSNADHGYIHCGESTSEDGIFKVKKFIDKPEAAEAERFINSREYLWNVGIFISRVDNILRSYTKCLPCMYMLFVGSGKVVNNEDDERQFLYNEVQNVPADFGTIEKAANVYVIPLDFGRSDAGARKIAYSIFNSETNLKQSI